MKTKVYEKSTVFKTTLDAMKTLHERIGPAQLSPPPIFVQVHRDTRTSLTEGELEFTLWMGFIPIRWLARHESADSPHAFADRMIQGPMAFWRHEHIFTPVENGVKLTDRLTIAHKDGLQGLLTRLMFDGIPLQILFFYRHLKTRWLLRRGKS